MLGTILAAAEAIGGIYQMFQGSDYSKTARPAYEIPPEAQQAMANARLLASLREMPGNDLLQGKEGANVAQAMKQLRETTTSPSSMTGAIADLTTRKNNADQNLSITNDQFWMQNQQTLREQLAQMAKLKEQQASWQSYEPYLQSMQAGAKLSSAGMTNLTGSLANLAQGEDTKQNWANLLKLYNGQGGGDNGQTSAINWDAIMGKSNDGSSDPYTNPDLLKSVIFNGQNRKNGSFNMWQ